MSFIISKLALPLHRIAALAYLQTQNNTKNVKLLVEPPQLLPHALQPPQTSLLTLVAF